MLVSIKNHPPCATRYFLSWHTAKLFSSTSYYCKTDNLRDDAHMGINLQWCWWNELGWFVRSNYDWPSVSAVKHYRNVLVRAKVLKLINTLDCLYPFDWENTWWGIVMGIETRSVFTFWNLVVLIRQHETGLRSSPYLQWPAWKRYRPKRQKTNL